MYVHAGRPAFARPCVGVHRSTSLMSSSLLLQQCPACLARLTWIVFVIGGRWPYSWCLVGCCRQMVLETVVQSQVKSYQRLKKWHSMWPCLTLRFLRYGSRVNTGNGVAPSPTSRCSRYWKGSLRVTLDKGSQLYIYIYISCEIKLYIYVCVCVCVSVCVQFGSSHSFTHVSLNSKDTFCLYNLTKSFRVSW